MLTWYGGLSAKAKAKFDNRVGSLKALPRHRWVRPLFDILHRECEGLGEIRFDVLGTAYRPLGFFSRGSTFTFVVPATERGGKFEPRNACEVGLMRRGEILSDGSRASACDF